MRVLVLSSDPLARQALRYALEREGGFVVQEIHAMRSREWTDARLQGPWDGLLWDLGTASEAAATFAEEIDIAWLALVHTAEDAREALRWGAQGVLFRDGQGERMIATLRAIPHGLTVIDDRFASDILEEQSTRSTQELPESLTPREEQALDLLAQGLSNKEIAARLQISEHTAKFHVNAVLGKFNARTRTEAVVYAARMGLLHL
ncbi:response regulator transcription factor [Myxococcota bacterium]|nr:response regulator transcription factor [Myxococcota bacterium]